MEQKDKDKFTTVVAFLLMIFGVLMIWWWC
jgi:hypothetical protein